MVSMMNGADLIWVENHLSGHLFQLAPSVLLVYLHRGQSSSMWCDHGSLLATSQSILSASESILPLNGHYSNKNNHQKSVWSASFSRCAHLAIGWRNSCAAKNPLTNSLLFMTDDTLFSAHIEQTPTTATRKTIGCKIWMPSSVNKAKVQLSFIAHSYKRMESFRSSESGARQEKWISLPS